MLTKFIRQLPVISTVLFSTVHEPLIVVKKVMSEETGDRV